MRYLSPFNTRYGLTPFSGNSFASLEKEFEKLFGGMPSLFDLGSEWVADSSSRSLRPQWYESDNEYVIRLELPGVDPKDVALEVGDNALRLSAERKTRSGEGESESVASYKQSFSIPEGIDGGKVSAKFEEGVLNVTLPKTEVLKPRRIEIK